MFKFKPLLLILSLFCFSSQTHALSTSAQSAVLMELESGRVLYEKNANDQRLIASITKLLTALVAVERCDDLQEFVTITEESCGVEGSSLYLTTETEITLEALLYGLLLHSGNDAAHAIALHCSGSVDEFVALMNEKATSLGMVHSSFANPHGLNAEGHYSSAYDMALVAQACLHNQTVSTIAATEKITLCGRTFVNKNKLLSTYEGCIGMKTGYTEKAGRTLVSAAQRDGMTLICVTLNDPNDWVDHSKLFDFGFSTYSLMEFTPHMVSSTQIPLENSILPFAQVEMATPFYYPLAEGECLSPTLIPPESSPVSSPNQGTVAQGFISWELDGISIAMTPLVYAYSYENLVCESESIWEKLQDKIPFLSP